MLVRWLLIYFVIYRFLNCWSLPSWISKNWKFQQLAGCRRLCVIMPNLVKFDKTVAETSQFNSFQNDGRLPSWIFKIQFFDSPGTHSALFCQIL